ncbi:MAG: SLC13/DASS family transporter [Alphaproteobacteria bacterium]|nr:SLC13/DASS family transporter [Alphaproteobacteria bacterium]
MRPLSAALLGVTLGVVAAGAVVGGGLSLEAAAVAGVAALCATWWTLEPIPIPATSVIPFVVLPFAGVLDKDAAAAAFGHPLILLLLGGFLLSTVMERSGAHLRVALVVIRALGRDAGGARAMLGFMVACAVLSMWISNTATTLMLLPVAGAVVARASDPERLGPPLFLGLAWSASIGGLGTPVGTPPNALLLAELEKRGVHWGFADFMSVGLPVVAVLVPLAWLWLCRGGRVSDIRVEVPELPVVRAPEVRALALFGVTILLWVTRTAPYGGWSGALDVPQVGDHTVALGMVVLAFLVPDGEEGRLLDWDTAKRIPWGLLLLFGGGIALGTSFQTSGLDRVIATALSRLGDLPLPLTVLTLALTVTFATEITSNTATAALLMPILSTAAIAAGDAPIQWLVPAALSASCAFMLPVATAPNAIVVGAGRVPTARMAREGLALNLMGAVVITAVTLAVL